MYVDQNEYVFFVEAVSHAPHACEEDGVHQVFADHGFFYPVEISVESNPPLQDFKWIKPSSFIKALHRSNDLSHLLGGLSWKDSRSTLLDFWNKYKLAFPQHQLWDEVRSGRKDITQCLPIFLHGDEGTSFKRGGILILSIQGAFGTGTSKSNKLAEQNLQAMGENIPLNFLGSGLQTRLLICACPKDRISMPKICVHI